MEETIGLLQGFDGSDIEPDARKIPRTEGNAPEEPLDQAARGIGASDC